MKDTNSIYNQIKHCIKNKSVLSQTLTNKIDVDGQDILLLALKENDEEVIEYLFSNTDYATWFKASEFKQVLDSVIKSTLEHSPFSLRDYRWCMQISAIEKLHTPEEKGRWLRIGLCMKDETITYYASKDGLWKQDIEPNIIFLEVDRLLNSRFKTCDMSYVDWFSDCLIKNCSPNTQKSLLLALLFITSSQHSELSKLKCLVDIDMFESGMYIDDKTKQDLTSSKILEKFNEGKIYIKKIQDKLLWNLWPEKEKNEFVQLLRNYSPSAHYDANNLREKCDTLIETVKPIFLLEKFDNDLKNQTTKTKSKKI